MYLNGLSLETEGNSLWPGRGGVFYHFPSSSSPLLPSSRSLLETDIIIVWPLAEQRLWQMKLRKDSLKNTHDWHLLSHQPKVIIFLS